MTNNLQKEKMFKIVVISDTHGNILGIKKILPIINESDFVIHLGDGHNDIVSLQSLITSKIICVKGNCDFNSNIKEEIILPFGQTKVMITHGHRYNVKSSLSALARKAEIADCSYVLYGHTHISGIKTIGSIQLINPGSFTISVIHKPSYSVMAGDGISFFTKIVVM